MKALQVSTPRKSVLDGAADLVVNLADLPRLSGAQAREFLDSNVLTSGMGLLLQRAFARMGGEKSASGIYELPESIGGGGSSSNRPWTNPMAKARRGAACERSGVP